jgi:hypothetical protein
MFFVLDPQNQNQPPRLDQVISASHDLCEIKNAGMMQEARPFRSFLFERHDIVLLKFRHCKLCIKHEPTRLNLCSERGLQVGRIVAVCCTQ